MDVGESGREAEKGGGEWVKELKCTSPICISPI